MRITASQLERLKENSNLSIEKLLQGYCPYCSEGPFRMVGSHISKKHGININEIKDALGINRRVAFCSEEVSKSKTRIAKDIGFGVTPETRGRFKGGNKFSETSKEKMKVSANTDKRKRSLKIYAHGHRAREKAAKTVMAKSELYFAILCRDFVKSISFFGSRGVYGRLAQVRNVERSLIESQIYHSVHRGFMTWIGEPWKPNGELTEKALKILEGDSVG